MTGSQTNWAKQMKNNFNGSLGVTVSIPIFDNRKNKSAVERILKSETYTGTLVQGKTGITARDEKNRVHNPEADWVIIKGAHEPLIDRELYRRSVEIREKKYTRTRIG